MCAAEPHCLRLGSLSKCHRHRIVRIQNGKIVRALRLENAGLRIRIILEAVMPVQMVLRHVQAGRDGRVKSLDGFQLKAGKLQHVPLIGPRTFHHLGRRGSDIAAHLARDPALAQNVASQRRGGSFSVGARDPDGRSLQEMARPVPVPQSPERRAHAPARANPDPPARPAKSPPAPHRETALPFEPQLSRLPFPPSAFHPPPEPARRAVAEAGSPPHRNAPSPPQQPSSLPTSSSPCYRSFNVVSANSAITNPAIQKRVMIFDSSQPNCSK